ncbi:acyltransferase family protein [Derxia lacustris]|uniref:acyltransferase family protein n=1 Tax=Derxia lacustris TaxID=764842 RepID=UPI000A1758A5|nr:acyltransferase [Derxia lacustris]
MRNPWVDYAKGIGIALVVWGHVGRGVAAAGLVGDAALHARIDSLLYSFHMPLFFFLSGLFFKESMARRSALQLVANKFDSVAYPFFVWSLLQGLLAIAGAQWTNTGSSLGGFFEFLWRPGGQFWFLYALFLIMMASLAIYRRRSLPWLIGVLIATVILHFIASPLPRFLPLGRVFFNFCFFSAGMVFNEFQPAVLRHKWRALPAVALAFAASEWLLQMRWPANEMLAFVTASAGIGLVAVGCMCLEAAADRLGWLAALGASSMAIYLAHILATAGTRVLLLHALHVRDYWTHMLVGSVCGLLLPLLAARLAPALRLDWLFGVPAALSLERRLGRGGRVAAVPAR